jgi:hypothetical protein
MASGHENRVSRPNTWLHRPSCNVKKTLANGAPSTHGTFRKCHFQQPRAARGSKADSSKPPEAPFMSSRSSHVNLKFAA